MSPLAPPEIQTNAQVLEAYLGQ
ncbi:MAG: hypothetical protein KME42_18335 [Tildeniella nuda ZEHNDER 1965/U140]|nr:hypothetical protein [Tildeniella nuda ZEHNDER 1965/U140]